MNIYTITIAIPVFNGEKYLKQAIESALLQSKKADEILVINNNSSDNTLKICQNYEPRIRVVSHPQTLSMADNWTSCFREAKSDFVMICHADDELFPRAVEETYKVIKEHPEVDHIFGQTWLYNGERSFPNASEKFGLLTSEEYLLRSCRSYYHYNSGTTTRKDLVLSIGGYNNEFKHITDVDFFIRVGLRARSVYAIDKPLGTYRIHQNNLHKTLNQENIADYEYIKLFEKIAQEYDIQESLKSQALKYLFPVLSQSITKALRQNNFVTAKRISSDIHQLRKKHGSCLTQTLTKNSRLILHLSQSNQIGLILAWLLINSWFFIRNSLVNENRPNYSLSDLTRITNYN
ncbi:MAG: glycosyltransferase family 2 protein [Cyanobacterium sp.]